MNRYRWTLNEEKLLVEMVNITCEKHSGRIDWTLMRPIGNHTLAAMQTRWSKNLKPEYTYSGKRYILSEQTTSKVSTPQKKRERSKKAPQIKSVKVSRSFLWGAIKYERYE